MEQVGKPGLAWLNHKQHQLNCKLSRHSAQQYPTTAPAGLTAARPTQLPAMPKQKRESPNTPSQPPREPLQVPRISAKRPRTSPPAAASLPPPSKTQEAEGQTNSELMDELFGLSQSSAGHTLHGTEVASQGHLPHRPASPSPPAGLSLPAAAINQPPHCCQGPPPPAAPQPAATILTRTAATSSTSTTLPLQHQQARIMSPT